MRRQDALYAVAETAPAASKTLNGPISNDGASAETEVTQRASQIATVMLAIESMIDELPDSSRTQVASK